MARAPSTKPDPIVVTVLDDTISIPRLSEYLYLDTLIKKLTDAKAELMGGFKPLGLPHFGKLAEMATEPKGMGKTIKVAEDGVSASFQLRANNGALKPADAATLSKARLPLEQIAAVEGINGDYALDADLIKRLKTLIAAHPEAMIPADFFIMTDPVITAKPDGSTLYQALQLKPEVRAVVVPLLASTVLVSPTGVVADKVEALMRARFVGPVAVVPVAEAAKATKKPVSAPVVPTPAPAPVVAVVSALRPKKPAHLKLVPKAPEPVPATRTKVAAKEVARQPRRRA